MKITAPRLALAAILMALTLLAGLGASAYHGAAQLAADGADLARVQSVLALPAPLQTSGFEAESALRGRR